MPKLAIKVVSWLDVQKDDVILDLGCGGEFSSLSHLVKGVSILHFIMQICFFVGSDSVFRYRTPASCPSSSEWSY